MRRILITGGAGFVGANVALALKQDNPKDEIICFDNLSRRGSELNVPRLMQQNIQFIHGDVRNIEDLAKIPAMDWLIECSAEPSVHAGYGESPAYLINTNLIGLINCLEYLRMKGGNLIFLSTSRVYPIALLRELPLIYPQQMIFRLGGERSSNRSVYKIHDCCEQREANNTENSAAKGIPTQTRLTLDAKIDCQGATIEGISETFSLEGYRSLYGATKLCGEVLIQEYRQMYGLKAIINRCGVIAGPWQMGKIDQGFVALWVARHLMGGNLTYLGFGGEGLQVRDVLHIRDLYALIAKQMQMIESLKDPHYNIGGGMRNSISLRELTEMVSRVTQKTCKIVADPHTREADIPFYVTDNSRIKQAIQWEPQWNIEAIVKDIYAWMQENADSLKYIFKA